MPERDITLLINDITEAIENIIDFTKGMTIQQYEADLKTRYAVERSFEIIGEAASRLPVEYKNTHAEIEWRIIKDFRNIIHDYFGIDNHIVWDTIFNTNCPACSYRLAPCPVNNFFLF